VEAPYVTHVARAKQFERLSLLDIPFEENNRFIAARGKSLVDPIGRSVQMPSIVLVRRQPRSTWFSDLKKHNSFSKLRSRHQQSLQGKELLRESTDVVERIDPDNELCHRRKPKPTTHEGAADADRRELKHR
jgi:hypothetical protein